MAIDFRAPSATALTPPERRPPAGDFRAPSATALAQMVKQFREIRRRVYCDSTRFDDDDLETHQKNQLLLRSQITALSGNSRLDRYGANTSLDDPEGGLWHLIWSRNRYAGIRSSIASREVADIKEVFDRYTSFQSPDWDLKLGVENGQPVVERAGDQVVNFLERSGAFEGKQTIGNLWKLRTIIHVARLYNSFIEQKSPQTPVYHFVTGGIPEQRVEEIHSRLITKVGYRSDLTALHLMMDMGFEVIKPDLIVTRLFLQWGWLHQIIPGLPRCLQLKDLQGRGQHKAKYLYTKPRMYWPVIRLARLIVSQLNVKDLSDDIGWASDNLLREFDIFVVKFGQDPEPHFGVFRRLVNWEQDSSENCDGTGVF